MRYYFAKGSYIKYLFSIKFSASILNIFVQTFHCVNNYKINNE